MALNIGDINFALGANTAGLRKAVDEMTAFGRRIDQIARSQEKGAAATVSALGRQEKALRSNLQAVLNLNAAIRRAGAPPELIAQNVRSFQALTRAMTQGQLSSVEFNRAQDRFAATLGKSRRQLNDFQKNINPAKVNSFTTTLRNLESASVLAVGPLSGIGARIRSLGAILGRTDTIMAALVFGSLAALTAGFISLGSAVLRHARSFEAVNARLEFVTGSAEGASRAYNYLMKTSRSLGLNIEVTAERFSTLAAATKGTRAEGEATRNIFLGLSQAASALRLSNEQVEGAFRAVEQMASKGIVQSEELRQQLAERIPGAVNIAANAFGVTTAKLQEMISKGLIPADEFLQKFGLALQERFADQAGKAADGLTGSFNNLTNASVAFLKAFDDTFRVTDAVVAAVQALTRGLDWLTNNMTTLAKIAGVAAGAILGMVAPKLLLGLWTLGKLAYTAALGFKAIAVAATTIPGAKLLQILMKLGLAVAGGTAAFILLDKVLKETTDSTLESSEAFQKYVDAMNVEFDTKAFDKLLERIREVEADFKYMVWGFRDLRNREAYDFADQLGITEFVEKTIPELNRKLISLGQSAPLLVNIGQGFTNQLEATAKNYERIINQFAANIDLDVSGLLSQGGVKALEEVARKFKDVGINSGIVFETIQALGQTRTFIDLSSQVDTLNKALTRTQNMERIRDIVKETMTESEKFRYEMQRLDELAIFAEGNLEGTQLAAALEGIRRAKNALNGTQKAALEFGDAFVSSFEEAILQTKRLSEVLEGLLQDILKILLRTLITAPLAHSIQGFAQGLIPSFGGGGSGGRAVPLNGIENFAVGANGLAMSAGRVQKFRRGGILGGPTIFNTRTGVALGGEAGTEGLIPLKRMSSGKLGVEATIGGGGGGVSLQIIDQRGASAPKLDVQRGRGPDGKEQIRIFIRSELEALLDSGAADKSMRKNYGLRRSGR